MWQTKLTKLIDTQYPIVQAGMAGGPTTPELVAAISNAGGLGSLGAGYLSPAEIRNSIRKIRSLTQRPFAVNLFVEELVQEGSAADFSVVNNRLNSIRQRLGIPENPVVPTYAQPFLEQVQVLLEEKVPVFSFTFGIPSGEILVECKARGILTIGTATTVREAQRLQEQGVDAIVAQGSEAGGHRGTFLHSYAEANIGTMALVPQIVDHVQVPVIASGGIMDGRGVVAALALGASGVQLGTAFLTCAESGAHPVYKQAIVQSTEESTTLIRVFSGKPSRGIRNQFSQELMDLEAKVPPYPIQNALTRDIRQSASKQNQPEYMSLWAGQGTRLQRVLPAHELMNAIVVEATAVMNKLNNNPSP